MSGSYQMNGAQPQHSSSATSAVPAEHPVFSQPIVNGDQCIGGTINIDFQV